MDISQYFPNLSGSTLSGIESRRSQREAEQEELRAMLAENGMEWLFPFMSPGIEPVNIPLQSSEAPPPPDQMSIPGPPSGLVYSDPYETLKANPFIRSPDPLGNTLYNPSYNPYTPGGMGQGGGIGAAGGLGMSGLLGSLGILGSGVLGGPLGMATAALGFANSFDQDAALEAATNANVAGMPGMGAGMGGADGHAGMGAGLGGTPGLGGY